MNIKFITCIAICITLVCQNVLCQESFNFKYQDFEVTTFPKEPGICPGKTSDVTCIETFESYKWELVYPILPFSVILHGQSQELKFPGIYKLTVEKSVNNILCSKQIIFKVHDLQSSEGIENYFINNCFYSVPIVIDQSSLKNEESDSRMSCEPGKIKFSNEFEYIDLNQDKIISNVVNNFKPFDSDEYDAIEVKSQNSCICDIGINELEEEFYSNPLSFWIHEYSITEDDINGKLYIKGVIPFEGDIPKNQEHKSHLESIHNQIISDDQNNADQDKATAEHLRIILSNLAMPNPTGGYTLETQCQIGNEEIGNNHIFTPTRLAVQLPSDASDIYIDNNFSSTTYGSFIKFKSANKDWQNYQRNEDYVISNGFFNPINAEFYEDFSTPISDCNECVIEVVNIAQGCDNFSCSFESNQYTTECFDLESVKDGGFNYEIESCSPTWTLWPITRRASKELIYDLLCAMKNGDPTFEFDAKFLGKVIFAQNIMLADVSYEAVGVKMPKEGNSIVLLDKPLLNNNGTTLGFINSFEICTDSDVRLNFLELDIDSDTETEALSKLCNGIIKASYTFKKWDVTADMFKNCLEYYNISYKYKLLDYLDPPDKENLLILVNGYRILGLSPGKKWYKGGSEYPTKDPKDAINTCFDNFEDGDYWGEAGVGFAKRINNNVIYVDGHHSIATSNHLQMITDDFSEISFLTSALTCLPFKYACLNYFCTLNDVPNGSGFFIRYTHGLGAGVRIWNKMVTDSIDVGMSDDKTQITGKIDIVAHSMGYAYSKGMIDYLTEKLAPGNTFGNYYIVAPENAVAYTEEEFASYSPDIQDDVVVDLSLFESVFQYGSNFTPNGDKKCSQDGVAPQARVRGLPNDNSFNVFIPDSEEKVKNFVEAHIMASYGWLFNILSGRPGYIKPRK